MLQVRMGVHGSRTKSVPDPCGSLQGVPDLDITGTYVGWLCQILLQFHKAYLNNLSSLTATWSTKSAAQYNLVAVSSPLSAPGEGPRERPDIAVLPLQIENHHTYVCIHIYVYISGFRYLLSSVMHIYLHRYMYTHSWMILGPTIPCSSPFSCFPRWSLVVL